MDASLLTFGNWLAWRRNQRFSPIALRAQAFAWFAFIEFARIMSSNELHFLKNKR